MSDKNSWIAVAKVRKAHGVKGQIRIISYSGSFDHLKLVKEVRVSTKSSIRPFLVESFTPIGNDYLIKLEGINNPEEVKNFSAADILIPRKFLLPCKSDEYYLKDLIGCNVLLKGSICGEVVSVITNAPKDLLELLKPDGKKVLIPMTKEFVGKINLAKKEIELLEEWLLG